MSENKKDNKKEILKESDKKDSAENKRIRSAQASTKVKLNERKEYTIKKDDKFLNKGDKVKLNKPTAQLFKAKGLID